MIKMRWLSVLLLLGLLLSACSSAKIKDECLVGRWMVTSDDVLAKAMLPPESFNLDDMRFTGVEGAAGYYFSQEGILTFQAVQWVAHFDVMVEHILMPLVVAVEGTATAKVSVDGDRITVGEVTQDLTSFTANLDGEEMMTVAGVTNFAPLFMPGAQTGQYKCEGDKLNITFTDQAGITYRLDFLRGKDAAQ